MLTMSTLCIVGKLEYIVVDVFHVMSTLMLYFILGLFDKLFLMSLECQCTLALTMSVEVEERCIEYTAYSSWDIHDWYIRRWYITLQCSQEA